jgi:Protein of unknown function (DUF2510)
MTTELPPAGWYPDPTGKPGQKYWDGQAWTDIPAPEIPATPKAGWYPDPSGKHGQMYWDGEGWHTTGAVPPKQRTRIRIQPTKANLIKGIVGVGLLVWLVAYNVPGFMGWVHKHQHPSGGTAQTSVTVDSSGSSAPSAPSTSSPSYQQGLKSGTDGYAEIQAFGPMGGAAQPYEQACQLSFNIDQGADPDLVQQDYIQGCLYGLNHQSAQWTQTRKTS